MNQYPNDTIKEYWPKLKDLEDRTYVMWNWMMPLVRKVCEDLLPYWGAPEYDTEAYVLQANIEFFTVNARWQKLYTSIINAIEYLKKKKKCTVRRSAS